jgi:hypothetical protein
MTSYLYGCFTSEITGNMHQIKSYLVSDRRNDETSDSASESEREIEKARFNTKNHFSE